MRKTIITFSLLLLSAVSCKAQSLAPGNIVDWNLTVTDPTASVTSFDILGPLSGNNSQMALNGGDLTSTSTELLFNFSGTDTGNFIVQSPTLFSGFDFWCLQSTNGLCSNQLFAGEALATNGPTVGAPRLGNLLIASGGQAQGTDLIYNVDEAFTIGLNTFTVRGFIETDGTITTTPEPSSLLLFGTGLMAAAGALRRKLLG